MPKTTAAVSENVAALRANEARDAVLFQIVQARLDIETLCTRNSDVLDFHSVSIWQLREALNDAFQAGREAALDGKVAPRIGAR